MMQNMAHYGIPRAGLEPAMTQSGNLVRLPITPPGHVGRDATSANFLVKP